MYSQNSPAVDIEELVSFLTKEHTSSHFYRGQTKFYTLNSPSALRRALTNKSEDGWNELDQKYWKKASQREQAKSDLSTILLTVFGRALGNIFCQQYGVTSDAYDITSDPIIAAFFATRKYPEYDQYNPNSDGEVGVIYRFKVKSTPPDLETVERTLNSFQMVMPDQNTRLCFRDIVPLTHLTLKRKMGDNKPEYLVNEKIPGKKSSAILIRQAAYIGPSTIRRIFLEKAKQLNFEGNLEKYFDSGRTFHQRGGIYYPPMRHTTIINSTIKAEATSNKKYYDAVPPVAISLGCTDVFELNSNPYVDRFFFKHRVNKKVEVDNLNVLWPSRDGDAIFSDICGVGEKLCAKYLSDYKIDILDRNLGLIDRGFFELTNN